MALSLHLLQIDRKNLDLPTSALLQKGTEACINQMLTTTPPPPQQQQQKIYIYIVVNEVRQGYPLALILISDRVQVCFNCILCTPALFSATFTVMLYLHIFIY